jgi:hypothetical protein
VTSAPGTQPVPTPPPSAPAGPDPQPVAAPVMPGETVLRPTPQKPAKSGGRAGAGTIVLVVGMIVAIGGIAFAVGRVTAPASTAAAGTRTGGFAANGGTGFPTGSFDPGAAAGRVGFGGAGGITGTVTAVAADHITIQVGGTTNGRTIDVPVSATTTYHTETPATAAAVTVGSEVSVRTARGTGAAGAAPGASGAPGALPGDAAPGASGGPGGLPGAGAFNVGTATDVTVIPSAAP